MWVLFGEVDWRVVFVLYLVICIAGLTSSLRLGFSTFGFIGFDCLGWYCLVCWFGSLVAFVGVTHLLAGGSAMCLLL